jgi:threonine synthase
MYSIDAPNIINLAINGVFDEAQDLVKAVNADAAFKARYSVGAVNSINWARVAAQIVYYVWGYLRLAPGIDREVQISVPTGNFGNIYAGMVARRLGLPIRFILATNENDVLDEFFRTEPRSTGRAPPTRSRRHRVRRWT